MNKQLFVDSIESIKNQVELDTKTANFLSRAFPNAFEANFLPQNHFLQNALVQVLQHQMNDLELSFDGNSWIEYFLWDLNFGEENYRLKAYDKDKQEIKLSSPGELWEFLNRNKSK